MFLERLRAACSTIKPSDVLGSDPIAAYMAAYDGWQRRNPGTGTLSRDGELVAHCGGRLHPPVQAAKSDRSVFGILVGPLEPTMKRS
jgi:hypothetical protein